MTGGTGLRSLAISLCLTVPSAALALAVEAAPPAAGKPVEKPAASAPAAVDGLQLTVVIRERTIRIGAVDSPTEVKTKVPTAVLKNVGEKALLLGFQLSGETGGSGGVVVPGRISSPDLGPIKVLARDSAGKDVPRREDPPREGAPKAEERPAVITVLKPGQALEQPLSRLVRLPADGKYTIWAELEVKPGEEVAPGVKLWTGKLKSNELEYDYRPFGTRGTGNRGGTNPPDTTPLPKEQL